MADGGAEGKPAMCYPYATDSLAGAFQLEAAPSPISDVPLKDVKGFSLPVEFLRCGRAVSIQFPGMLDHPLLGSSRVLYLALLEVQFSTL